jgi:hypothetical protein
MKFNCGPTSEEIGAALQQWHRWFAWRPVRIGSRDCRWLEWVERKGTYFEYYMECGWSFEYRALTAE